MDGCSHIHIVKNLSVDNPIQYFLPDNVFPSNWNIPSTWLKIVFQTKSLTSFFS